MWKPFREATYTCAPQAEIVFDKFHLLRHLNDALEAVRQNEYARLQGDKRRFIKGNRYTLLSHRENLDLEGRKALKTLLAANKRLNTAYLLKESFGQLWDYECEGWARALLRELEEQFALAAASALREVRGHDRTSLGWHRLLLQAREQSLAWLRRRIEQHHTRYPAQGVRLSRRGIPGHEDHYPFLTRAPKTCKNHPHDSALSPLIIDLSFTMSSDYYRDIALKE